jgi:hypothetical protein
MHQDDDAGLQRDLWNMRSEAKWLADLAAWATVLSNTWPHRTIQSFPQSQTLVTIFSRNIHGITNRGCGFSPRAKCKAGLPIQGKPAFVSRHF